MSGAAITSAALRPHDLLWIGGPGEMVADEAVPAWVTSVLGDLPVVVVRRDRWLDDRVPVGVRGRWRNERFAAWVPVGRISKHVAPEQLLSSRCEPTLRRLETIAALRTFFQVEEAWAGVGLPWGPVGSVGFELATGSPTATDKSDLDLVIRAPSRLSPQEGRTLLAALGRTDAAVDVTVETDFVSFSLREYCDGRSVRRLAKTPGGPRLVADPWQDVQGDLE
jgi:phosphoribosyl-dephospho-CoA transferase